MKKHYYHVVTERPMNLNQIIQFDQNTHSGVYERVYSLKNIVDKIYQNSENFNDKNLDHHTKVALRELALEEVRKNEFPDYPSRLESLYVSSTYEEAKVWFDYFSNLGRPTYQIVKVETDGSEFTGDACNCFDGTIDKNKNIELARYYWSGNKNKNGKTPIYETLINGRIRVIAILEERIKEGKKQ